ncbi:MAG: hypothetical protein HKN28_09980, partial [Alphaproteobacteria bacterium]|nr:hypothetical protein [Alphaproteobacteria bacterium]
MSDSRLSIVRQHPQKLAASLRRAKPVAGLVVAAAILAACSATDEEVYVER